MDSNTTPPPAPSGDRPAALVVGCTCGVGDGTSRYAHETVCHAPLVIDETLYTAAMAGLAGGALTVAEYDVVMAIAGCVRARHVGDRDIDDALAAIRRVAAGIDIT